MEIDQIQARAKEALEVIDKIFHDKKIPYYLLAGSALGAIRHKDMIPWDDDIDIGIYFSDSDKVATALKKAIIFIIFKVSRIFSFSLFIYCF